MDLETTHIYIRNRYYNPSTGRFLSEDPIGFAGEDTNLYRYVGNNPVSYRDPSGTILLAPILGGALIGGGIDLGLQLIDNGGSFKNIDWGSVASSAAIGGAFGGLGRIFGPFSPKGLPKGIARWRGNFRIDPPHHSKGWHLDGKWVDKIKNLLPTIIPFNVINPENHNSSQSEICGNT